MAQKMITSFFKPQTTSPDGKEAKVCPTSHSRKRLRIESSDEEEPDSKCLVNNTIKSNHSLQDNSINKESNSATRQVDINTTSPTSLDAQNENSVSIIEKQDTRNVEDISTKKEKKVNTETGEIKNPFKQLPKRDNLSLASKEDVSVSYNPAKSNYDPMNDAFWKGDASTPYLALARTFQQVEDIKGRLKMIEMLGNFFSSVILLNAKDLLPSVYLSINQLAPAYEGLELGVAETSLMKAICNATGRDLKYIKIQTQKTGDLGIVAEQSRIAQRRMFQPAPLTISGVFRKLKEVARISGPSKFNIIQDVFVACRFSEARYFIRSLIGKLRIGIAEQSLIYALATAFVKANLSKQRAGKKLSEVDLKSEIDKAALIIKTAYCQCPNYEKIIPTLLEHGLDELLERCPMQPGVPIKPMLAQPTKGVYEVLQRFEGLHITCEWKYDGERAQIHRNKDGVVSIYSRNQEDNTLKYPDVISRIGQVARENVKSFIVDSEIVAWDVERKQILPFQVLSTRKRKNVDIDEIKVQVCVYAFDLLYMNDEPLVVNSFVERRQLLKENFGEVEGIWKFAASLDTHDMDEVQQFLEESIKGNCEGLMVKTLDVEATYEIAKRSRNWLKLKKDYMSNVGDSLDLVVIGAYEGKGKRTGTYGGFLLACHDEENEEYQSICKIGTGFSDEDLATHTAFLKEHTIATPKLYYQFDTSLEPDVWFEPVQVWEIKCADLSLSPIHRAAIGITDPERGISLRFPRFIRIREDKSPEHATSAQQVAYMYNSQDQIKNNQKAGVTSNDFEDFY